MLLPDISPPIPHWFWENCITWNAFCWLQVWVVCVLRNLSLRFCKFKLALTGIQVCIEIIKFAFFRTQVCVCENLSLHQKNQVVVNRSELLRTRYFSSHFIAILFTYQCKPHGGGLVRQGVQIWRRDPSLQWEIWSSTLAQGSGHLIVCIVTGYGSGVYV